MKLLALVAVAAAGSTIAACSSGPCFTKTPTITGGVYGFVTIYSQGTEIPQINDPIYIQVQGGSTITATGTTDSDGFYEIELPAGKYVISESELQTARADVDLSVSARTRFDFIDDDWLAESPNQCRSN